MTELIISELKLASDVISKFSQDQDSILKIHAASKVLISSLKKGNKIISCGNGGSHCEAMHFAEELTGRYREDRPGIAAIAISDPTHISCAGNDFGFDHVYARYVESVGKAGDVLVCFSTSGKSANILQAAKVAKEQGMQVIGLTGKDGGPLAELCDVEIRVDYQGWADRIQEVHTIVMHILINLIEKGLTYS